MIRITEQRYDVFGLGEESLLIEKQTVTVTEEAGMWVGMIESESQPVDTNLRVTFDGMSYIAPYYAMVQGGGTAPAWGAPFDEIEGPDFSEYPFIILYQDGWILATANEGPHTIEAITLAPPPAAYIGGFFNSNDTKPMEIDGSPIATGSWLIEVDNKTFYLYDEKLKDWVTQFQFGGGGGGGDDPDSPAS